MQRHLATAVTGIGIVILFVGFIIGSPFRTIGSVTVLGGGLLWLASHIDQRLNRVDARLDLVDQQQRRIAALVEADLVLERVVGDDTGPLPRHAEPARPRLRLVHSGLVAVPAAVVAWLAGRARDHAVATAAVASAAVIAPFAVTPILEADPPPPRSEASEIGPAPSPARARVGDIGLASTTPTPTPSPAPTVEPTEPPEGQPGVALPQPTPSSTPLPTVTEPADPPVATDPTATPLPTLLLPPGEVPEKLQSKLGETLDGVKAVLPLGER